MATVFDQCRVSPPPATVGHRSLPLTFFDITWLLFPPINPLFFFKFPHSKTEFVENVVPRLKHSLSLTLQYFFPIASNLIVFPSKKPEFRHVEGDSVELTFAESSLDFDDLAINDPRDCGKFYPLVPRLGQAVKGSGFVSIPVFSIQVTFFPNSGFSIGIANHHALCDGRSAFDFFNAWALIARHGSDEPFLANGYLPFYDRSVIKYPNTLDEIHLNQPGLESLVEGYQPPHLVGPSDKVRATFILTRDNINQAKKLASIQLQTLKHVTSFSILCAYVWSCLAKSRASVKELEGDNNDNDKALEKFVTAVESRARLDPPIPRSYFGNCIMPCVAVVKRNSLTGNEGFLTAIKVVGEAISATVNNENGVIKDAETWQKKITEGILPTIGITGSPKIRFYDVDFGWGRPEKFETVSLDYAGAISVNASKESSEDLEVTLSLPAKEMEAFVTFFANGLK